VSLLLAPTLAVEAVDDGIRIENLATPFPWTFAAGEVTNDRREYDLPPRLIWNPERCDSKMLAILPGITEAAVYRPRAFLKEPRYADARLIAIHRIKTYYAKEYPPLMRFLRTIGMPARWQIAAERVGNFFEKVRNPGPYCSELVADIFKTLGLVGGRAARFMPSDFAYENSIFKAIPEAIVQVPDDVARSSSMRAEHHLGLMSVLAPPETDRVFDVELMRVIQLRASIERQWNNASWDANEQRRKAFDEKLDAIERWGHDASDPFWEWLRAATACYSSCPIGKKCEPPAPISLDAYRAMDITDRLAHMNQETLYEASQVVCPSIFDCRSHELRGRSFRRVVDGAREAVPVR
jgi:hypothetical protein